MTKNNFNLVREMSESEINSVSGGIVPLVVPFAYGVLSGATIMLISYAISKN